MSTSEHNNIRPRSRSPPNDFSDVPRQKFAIGDHVKFVVHDTAKQDTTEQDNPKQDAAEQKTVEHDISEHNAAVQGTEEVRIQLSEVDLSEKPSAASTLLRSCQALKLHLRRLIDLDDRYRAIENPWHGPSNPMILGWAVQTRYHVQSVLTTLDQHIGSSLRDNEVDHFTFYPRESELTTLIRAIERLEVQPDRLVGLEQVESAPWTTVVLSQLQRQLEGLTVRLLDHMGPVGGRDGQREW
ncbi:uncharacterized protein MYCGRDRAFT_94910 [Zymoseptoria tritici IPO323]|uniref:Uncharacterized protein n=1 Tax=Zymoseptoria tritici (strain CBS 115943 / IPO323) TaxID=336722 RepID=F9XI25_ZYMTI|nr:uncharacterized protein MYCGRDRAFT_94910 [Zymoseptoria tritici IPO323]EGP85502.1 hypothetical protein MYCGRDRAFT_94910 [Zymoseptoria tritici IPO323]